MALFSDLSQELVDLILDHLRLNHKALDACSRVARAWLFASRRHLFERLVVDGTNKTVGRFTKFISNAPDIAFLIKEFELYAVDPIYLDSTVFSSVLKELPSLRGLALSEVQIRSSDKSPSYWNIAHLDYLELNYEYISTRHLVQLLAPFSLIPIKAVLFDVAVKGNIEKCDLSAFTSSWNLQDLRLMGFEDQGPVFDLMTRAASPNVLHNLSLGAGLPEQLGGSFGGFMTKFGPTIQKLQLEIMSDQTPPQRECSSPSPSL